MVIENKVTPYMLNFICNKCEREVKFNGDTLLTNPPMYEHICTCGEVYRLGKQYPFVEFR